MRDLEVGRLLRLVRMRKGLRLKDLSDRCGLSTSALGRIELGSIQSLPTLRRHAAALDLRVDVYVVGRGADVPRLLDDEHAAIVEALTRGYLEAGWKVELEASFGEAIERGRIDLLASDPRTGALAVVEVKSEVANLQELLGSLASKIRVAPAIAGRLGWASRKIVGVLAVASTGRNRHLVATHPATFQPFVATSFRGVGTLRHLDSPRVLLWVAPWRAGRRRWLAGRRRVRRDDGSRR